MLKSSMSMYHEWQIHLMLKTPKMQVVFHYNALTSNWLLPVFYIESFSTKLSSYFPVNFYFSETPVEWQKVFMVKWPPSRSTKNFKQKLFLPTQRSFVLPPPGCQIFFVFLHFLGNLARKRIAASAALSSCSQYLYLSFLLLFFG